MRKREKVRKNEHWMYVFISYFQLFYKGQLYTSYSCSTNCLFSCEKMQFFVSPFSFFVLFIFAWMLLVYRPFSNIVISYFSFSIFFPLLQKLHQLYIWLDENYVLACARSVIFFLWIETSRHIYIFASNLFHFIYATLIISLKCF